MRENKVPVIDQVSFDTMPNILNIQHKDVKVDNIPSSSTVTYLLNISECTISQKQQVEKEKSKFHVTHHTSYEVVKRNLPSEHKQMHKFTKVANREREKQISSHSPHFLSE